ncbi:MAG: YihA family ribosome biogenesis GTP-binding protein [Syntrophomonadaceae bacterium]|mgnify:FL=1|nr:YihA family ribosome biogenesis GTP-binding protein [Syntrophomonadaceae bacterium]
MKITSAEFVLSVASPAQYPRDNLPELALVGRSNVGKSSLINKLVGRRALARTSSTPGKTRHLNFYRINNCWYWVDLPGYGFARVSKSMRSEWQKLIERYLKNRQTLRGVIQLMDIRHPPTADDIQMYQWLRYYDLPTILVVTKADKISRGRWPQHLKVIRQALGLPSEQPLIVFSAETGVGVEELGAQIEQLLG